MQFSLPTSTGSRRVSSDMLLNTFTSKTKTDAIGKLNIAEQFVDLFGQPNNKQAVEALFDQFFPEATSAINDRKISSFNYHPESGNWLTDSSDDFHLLLSFVKTIVKLIPEQNRAALTKMNSPVRVDIHSRSVLLRFFDRTIFFNTENVSSEAVDGMVTNLHQLCFTVIAD